MTTDESFHAWLETQPEIRRLGTLGHDIAKAAWVAGMHRALEIVECWADETVADRIRAELNKMARAG